MSKSSYDIENTEQLQKLCNFLRSREGPAVREALLMEKRVHYLKGEKLVNFLVEPKKGTKWPSDLPRFSSRQEALIVCKELCKRQYLLRSEKREKGVLGVRSCSYFRVPSNGRCSCLLTLTTTFSRYLESESLKKLGTTLGYLRETKQ